MKSIIERDREPYYPHERWCFVCGSHENITEHHIFGGNPNRKNSEKYGLKVDLCFTHHQRSPTGVHHDGELMQKLHEIGQKAFEENHGREDFIRIFGKNYLGYNDWEGSKAGWDLDE